MKTILSFQDKKHRVQLTEHDYTFLYKKYVIYDNRQVINTEFGNELVARKLFLNHVRDIVLQTHFEFPN